MIAVVIGALHVLLSAAGQGTDFPLVQAVPLPDHQVGFEVEGLEVARYHYGPTLPKPYVFPLIGPAGHRLTRLTHPHAPEDHGHHLSIWVGHQNVNGLDFWVLSDTARIVHESIEEYTDGPDAASVTAVNIWRGSGDKALLKERRTTAVRALPNRELYLDTIIELTPAEGKVTFGKTSFGLFAVRVAKSMTGNDGGGVITNSEGSSGEKDVFWKRARWVDYTGPVTPTEKNGITLFDHPDNPGFPTGYHVRDDGWMGASFSLDAPFELEEGKMLTLRYRLYAHDGKATAEAIDRHWQRFADE